MEQRTSRLSIITCHFNPQGYWRPVNNYWRFRHALGDLQRQLITVELSFDGRFDIPDAIHIRGSAEQNVMWQKEALINFGLQHLPDRCDVVAWIDADVLFLHPHWVREMFAALESVPVVQLWERVLRVGPAGKLESDHHVSSASLLAQRLAKPPGSPGLAWAARRAVLEQLGGLPDRQILGGGDRVAFEGFAGTVGQGWYFSRYNAPMQDVVSEWGLQACRITGGKVGYLPHDVVHLYHGSRERRQYADRIKILTGHQYDPRSDVRINPAGILEWANDNPQLHQGVADYFAHRREDE